MGNAEIVTQPGTFSLSGDGLCVGRDSGSPVTADYLAAGVRGGTIERVLIDVSGEPSSTTRRRCWPVARD